MKLAILDDYQRVALSITDWSVVEDRLTITAFDQHLGDLDAVAKALLDFDVIVIMRERTPFPSTLLGRLPKLKLLVTTGMRNLAIDMVAAREQGLSLIHI